MAAVGGCSSAGGGPAVQCGPPDCVGRHARPVRAFPRCVRLTPAAQSTAPEAYVTQRLVIVTCWHVRLVRGPRGDTTRGLCRSGSARRRGGGGPSCPAVQHRCNFSKSIGGPQGVKSAQGTIKILLKSDFSSGLTHFLAIIGGEGTRASKKDIKLGPCCPVSSQYTYRNVQ